MSKLAVVNTARERLLTEGWAKGFMRTVDGRVCLLGAFCPTSSLCLGEIISDLEYIVGGPITLWNDDPRRTFNDVIGVLDELILKVKEEEMEEE